MATSLLGSYTTNFAAGTNGRNTNLDNATSKINDTVLMPGEVFSTNEAFGEMSFDNGYAMGGTIVAGKMEDGMGGGVCQVSSTLYHALLYAELEIVERQNHSLKVGYMDWGFDATLAGDYIDLKFKNDTEYPVTIEAYTTSNQVIVNIYGHEIHDPSRNLVFENALINTVPPAAEVITEDPTLPLGERVEDMKPRTGYVYNVYKLVYENGEFLEKVQVNTSSYRATRGEFRVGTGPAAPVDGAIPADGTIPTDGTAPVEGEVPTELPAQGAEPPATESPVPQGDSPEEEVAAPADDAQSAELPETETLPADEPEEPVDLPEEDLLDEMPLMP
jgi:hypothetical protein